MKVSQPELETPNGQSLEVQMTKKANTIQPSSTENYVVQPKKENYATSGIKQNTMSGNQVQNNQNANTIVGQNSTVVQRPSDLYDTTVQGYLNSYDAGVRDNDYQAQINALTAIDNYRTSKGYKPIYTQSVYELNNKRNEKIKNVINNYDYQIAEAMNSGNSQLAQQLGQELTNYKNSVNYVETSTNPYLSKMTEKYKSAYDDVINGIVNELLTLRFTYDPSDDKALAKAQEHASNVAMEKMNAKGILDSSMTAQVVTSVVSELEETYRKMAKEEFYQNVERLKSMANFVADLDDRQYTRWKNNVQMNLEYYEALKDEISFQWDRVNKLGYVDNTASIILGVAPGTMSPEKRQAMEEAQAEAKKRYDELQSDIKLAEVKARLSSKSSSSSNNSTGGMTTGDYSGTFNADNLIKLIDDMDGKYSEYDIIKSLRKNAKTEADYTRALAYMGYTLSEADKILNQELSEEEQMIQQLKRTYSGRGDGEIYAIYAYMKNYNMTASEAGETLDALLQVMEMSTGKGAEWLNSLTREEILESLVGTGDEQSNTRFSVADYMQDVSDLNRANLEAKAVTALSKKYPNMTDEEMIEIINNATKEQLKEMIGGK